jgi:putative transposase
MTQEQKTAFANLKPLCEKKLISTAVVASHCGIGIRQVQRLLTGLEPKPRTAWNRIGDDVKNYVCELKCDQPDLNAQWIAELVSDRFGYPVSRSSVYRTIDQAGLWAGKPVSRTPRSRFEAEGCGDLVQMDTSWGYWLDRKKVCLILLLDDYSRYILHARFVEHDTAAANMRMIKETVERYGLFRILYTDNASFFKAIRHGTSRHQAHAQQEYETEIGRSCREAGITHLTHKPYQPQGKGKIERLFRFVQERFVSRIDPDWSLDKVNLILDRWVQWYNESHRNRTIGCTPRERFSLVGFSPLPAEENLADVFCWKYTRKVDSCNEFSLDGKRYVIPKEHCLVAFRVELHVVPHETVRVWHKGEFVCELFHQS